MEKVLNADEILGMPIRQRRNFMNTLPGIRGLHLIGTQSETGIANLGLFSSVVHIGANPPLLGFILRPLTVHRQTYAHIKATGHYTINMVERSFLQKAHQSSAKYPADVSEFEAVGLQPQYSERIKAPYVEEARIKIGLAFEEEQHIRANGTWLIIGRVEEVIIPEGSMLEKGHIDPEAWGAIGVSGLDRYYSLNFRAQLAYARPK